MFRVHLQFQKVEDETKSVALVNTSTSNHSRFDSGYQISGWITLQCFGWVYLCAFASWYFQIEIGILQISIFVLLIC